MAQQPTLFSDGNPPNDKGRVYFYSCPDPTLNTYTTQIPGGTNLWTVDFQYYGFTREKVGPNGMNLVFEGPCDPNDLITPTLKSAGIQPPPAQSPAAAGPNGVFARAAGRNTSLAFARGPSQQAASPAIPSSQGFGSGIGPGRFGNAALPQQPAPAQAPKPTQPPAGYDYVADPSNLTG